MSDLDVASPQASAQPSSSSSAEEVLTPIKTQQQVVVISSSSSEGGDLLESLLGKRITECYSCGSDVQVKNTTLCQLCQNGNCLDSCFVTTAKDWDICTRCWYKDGERDRVCQDVDPNDYKTIKKLEMRVKEAHFPPNFPHSSMYKSKHK